MQSEFLKFQDPASLEMKNPLTGWRIEQSEYALKLFIGKREPSSTGDEAVKQLMPKQFGLYPPAFKVEPGIVLEFRVPAHQAVAKVFLEQPALFVEVPDPGFQTLP